MTQRFDDDPAAIPGSLMIRKAIVRAYDPATHKADLQIVGSHPTLAPGLRVATNIPAADVVPGRQATVLFLDPANPDDAVIVAVQGALPSTGQLLQATATADLTLTTSAQSITGDGDAGKVRLLLPTPGDWSVAATCDFENTVDDPAFLRGELFVNDSGTPETALATYRLAPASRATIGQRWKITTTAADTPVELKARKTGAGTAVCRATHTRLSASGVKRATGGGGVTDHGALTGLGADDHTQYLLLAGRAGGQAAKGGIAASQNLTLESTAHATKGEVQVVDGSVFAMRKNYGNYIGQGGGTPDVMLYVKNQLTAESVSTHKSGLLIAPFWAPSADARQLIGLGGAVIIDNTGRTGTYGFGLNFPTAVWGGSFTQLIGALVAPQKLIAGVATTITDFEGVRVEPTIYSAATITRYASFRSNAAGNSGMATAIGLKVDDITLGTNKYLIEVGPTTPNLRVEATTPASGTGDYEDSRVLIAFRNSGGVVTLRRLHTLPYSSLTAAMKVVVAI